MPEENEPTPQRDTPDFARRGPGVLLGMLALSVAGLLTLFGFAYGPIQRGTNQYGSTSVAPGQAWLGVTENAVAVLLALGATYLFRGSPPMIILCLVVIVVASIDALHLVPYL